MSKNESINKRVVALNALLVAQFIIGYVIYESPNLIFYSVSVFAFVFITTMLMFSKSKTNGSQTARLSQELTGKSIAPFMAGLVVELLLLVIATVFNLPVMRFISLLIFVAILYVLSLIVAVVDAGVMWSLLKKAH